MTIYVEYVVIDNFVIDLLILLLTKSLLKIQTKKMFLFLSATFGTIIAVISPLLPNTVNILIKIPLALSMILIAFLPNNLKIFFAEAITFLISTFAMIGCCLAISELFHIDVVTQNGIIMEYKFPVGVVLLICFVVFVCLKNIYGLIFKRQKLDELSFDITLKNQNNTIKTQAFLDTGNKLMLDEKPITIIGYKTFFKLFPQIDITNFLLNKSNQLKNAKYIYVQSVGEKKQSLVFEIDEIVINNSKKENMPIMISKVDFLKNTGCDVVISGDLIN